MPSGLEHQLLLPAVPERPSHDRGGLGEDLCLRKAAHLVPDPPDLGGVIMWNDDNRILPEKEGFDVL